VIVIEHVQISPDGQWMTSSDVMKPWANVGRRANDARRGDVVLYTGIRMGPAQIATAATVGAAEISVYRRPRMAILVTGDELVPVGQTPAPGQIRNSNGPCLTALAYQAGCEVIDLGMAKDDPQQLAERMRAGLAADIFCISGGMSMGQHDHVPDVLREAGVQIKIQKIAIKPGKPTVIGLGPAGPIGFGLPGNPVSCFVCFLVFVRAALEGLCGRAVCLPASFPIRIDAPLRATGPRVEYIPVWVCGGQKPQAQPVSYQGSGDPFGLARANGLMIRQANAPAAEAGVELPVVPLDIWPQE
jgi:molybdopterin molybdotransferase